MAIAAIFLKKCKTGQTALLKVHWITEVSRLSPNYIRSTMTANSATLKQWCRTNQP